MVPTFCHPHTATVTFCYLLHALCTHAHHTHTHTAFTPRSPYLALFGARTRARSARAALRAPLRPKERSNPARRAYAHAHTHAPHLPCWRQYLYPPDARSDFAFMPSPGCTDAAFARVVPRARTRTDATARRPPFTLRGYPSLPPTHAYLPRLRGARRALTGFARVHSGLLYLPAGRTDQFAGPFFFSCDRIWAGPFSPHTTLSPPRRSAPHSSSSAGTAHCALAYVRHAVCLRIQTATLRAHTRFAEKTDGTDILPSISCNFHVSAVIYYTLLWSDYARASPRAACRGRRRRAGYVPARMYLCLLAALPAAHARAGSPIALFRCRCRAARRRVRARERTKTACDFRVRAKSCGVAARVARRRRRLRNSVTSDSLCRY